MDCTRLFRVLAAVFALVVLPRLAMAQEDGAPCAGHVLKCVQTAPNFPLARDGVVRVFARYRYDSGQTAAGCGTGWYIANRYTLNNVVHGTIITNRHVLEGVDNVGHYVTTSVQVEFFYIPLPNRACGVEADNECHIFPGLCSNPTIIAGPCWDWDLSCDLGRIFIPVGNIPANAAPLTLGANPVVGQAAWIPQHPQARCMEWDDGIVAAVPAGCDFTYDISTQGGSSGSPVLDEANQVVGVHRAASGIPGVCPNIAVKVSELVRFLGVAPAPNCQVVPVEPASWGRLKFIYR